MAHESRPRSDATNAQATAEPTTSQVARVLVVDDDLRIGSLIRKALGAAYVVEFITDARVALARIEAGERFDVILSDVMMPDMSGVEFHRALERSTPDQHARVIFITGGATDADAESYLHQVANPLVEKPFDLRRLRALVREFAAR